MGWCGVSIDQIGDLTPEQLNGCFDFAMSRGAGGF